jgi:hypothetical protein
MPSDEIEFRISKKSMKALNELTEQVKSLNLASMESLVRIRELSQAMKSLPWYVRLILAIRGK